MMSYVVPYAEPNDEILSLLDEIALIKTDNSIARRNLTDPFSNYGKNAHFTQGFSEVKFQL